MKLARWGSLLAGVVVLAACFPQPPPPPPPNDTIVFVSDRTGNPEIWSMRSDGSQQTQLTTTPDTEIEPKLSSACAPARRATPRDSGPAATAA